MDSLELIREMYGEIDPDEQIQSSGWMNSGHDRSTRSSPPAMEPSQPFPVNSVGPSPPMDAIQSVRDMYEKIDPVEQIDPLVSFVETQLHKMNSPSEAGSSPSEGSLETVLDGTKQLAAKTIDTISTEAEKLSISVAVDALGSLTLKVVKGFGELHLVFIGLSVAAFSVDRYMKVSSTENECKELLLKILQLAHNIKQSREQMHERGKLCNAVGTIVEGAVICCDYLTRGTNFRFWSATTAGAQVEKTDEQLRDSLGLSSLQQVKQLLDFQCITDYEGDKDVFLSHSGKQKNFVRHLDRYLSREHVSCFLDEKSLPLAQKFPSLIFKHAQTCKIGVLVLSKEFIRSKWPMLELSAFIGAMNSGKNANLKLFPIFFMISPKELHITKNSPEWSEWQKLGVSNDIKGEWQAALDVVRSINGLHFGEDENEVVFIDKVVKEICCILKRINLESHPQLLDFKPVGVEETQNKVIELLNLRDSSRRVVVIYGVGGIGKTTLATAAFSSLDLSGHHHCEVFIDQDSKHSDLKVVQEKILHYAFKRNPKLYDCNQGREELSEAFRKASKPVFLLIDNALRQTDLEMLLPIRHLSRLPMQSRLLLTTRNLKETKILQLQNGIQVYSHRVDSVSETDAKRILCHYALGDENGSFDRGVNMDGLLQFCGGIPLVLRIVGSHLHTDGNSVSACKEILEYLKKWQQKGFEGGEEDLSERIVDFVYKRLKEPTREIFLDIVFFFHDWTRSRVVDIVGEMELRDLEAAALVTTSEEGNVKVHDIVRSRGKKLSEGNRITDSELLSILLRDEQKLQQIKGIWLDEKLSLEAQQVDLMSRSLRVLRLGHDVRVNGRCERAFKDLRYLGMFFENIFPIDLSKSRQLVEFGGGLMKGHGISEAKLTINLPDSDSLRRLYLRDIDANSPVSLDIYGNPTSLRKLEIFSFTLERLPEGNLEILVMKRCLKMCTLPRNFGQLKCLKFLDIRKCKELKKLPDDIVCLTSLAVVRAGECPELEAKAMDFLVEINSLLYLEMGESPMLIKRWEEIQQDRPLIAATRSLDVFPYKDIYSTMFFNGASKFLHVDGEGQLGEVASCSFPEVGVKVGLLLTACDLSMEVREKAVEVASHGFQIMYVDVGGEREAEEERNKRIREVLLQLPEGSRAWTSRFQKTTLFFAYSLWQRIGRVDTSIVGSRVVGDWKGKKILSYPLETIFRSDVSDCRRVDFTTLFSPLQDAWESLDMQ